MNKYFFLFEAIFMETENAALSSIHILSDIGQLTFLWPIIELYLFLQEEDRAPVILIDNLIWQRIITFHLFLKDLKACFYS
ncbi:MAG TPA: hypothetical protein DHM90_08015 [Clostridiaceae bacterium]|nr:hypothetical protein [Clostridiaceae bacterium]